MEQQNRRSGIRSILRRPQVIALLILLAIVGIVLYNVLQRTPPTSITASGIIEATQVTLASKVLARVVGVFADEGSLVNKGELIVRLQDTDFRAQVSQAQSALAAAQARLREALNGARPEDIEQARAQVNQAQSAVTGAQQQLALAQRNVTSVSDLQANLEAAQTNYNTAVANYQRAQEALQVVVQGARPEQIQAAQAAVQQAQAVYSQSVTDFHRNEQLFQKGAISASQLDASRTAMSTAQAELAAAKARLADLQAGATPAEIREAKAAVEQARAQMTGAERQLNVARQAYEQRLSPRQQLEAARTQYQTSQAQLTAAQAHLQELLAGTRPEEIQAAQAQADQARAAVTQVQTLLANTRVYSPINGAVITRAVEPGDMATIGSTLMVLADLTSVDLIVYIEEPVYGRIKLGQTADVTVNSYPNTVFTGHVTKIAQQAEFTPKEIQTPEQRAKLVFAVKVTISNPQGKLKPGMPADAVMKLQPVSG